MDKEPEEMRYMGVGGVVMEAWKLMRSYGRLFASITTTLVLPLCFVILAHRLVSAPLSEKILRQEDVLEGEEGTAAGMKLRQKMNMETMWMFVLGVVYLIFVLAFSLLSFAAIVYSVACIYTGKGVAYMKVLSVVPKVWKRLMVTFLWIYLIIFAYQLVFLVGAVILIVLMPSIGNALFWFLFTLLVVGLLVLVTYLHAIWDMASVVSVLEDTYGLGALKKSVELLKGKRLVACALVLMYVVPNVITSFLFQYSVVHSHKSIWWRAFIGAIYISDFAAVYMMGIIVKSVLYFVCKAHHHESIDRYALSDHLDGYLGEYMPLKDPIPLEALEP